MVAGRRSAGLHASRQPDSEGMLYFLRDAMTRRDVLTLEPGDALAVALVIAIKTGDVDELRRMLGESPGSVSAESSARREASARRCTC